MDYIVPFLVETAADPLTQSLVHRAVINQEHEELPYTCTVCTQNTCVKFALIFTSLALLCTIIPLCG